VILCLDAGNSCLKWGVADRSAEYSADHSGWREQGELVWTELARLRQILLRWKPSRAYLASVVDAAREAELAKEMDIPVTRFTSSSAVLGVQNGYAKPETLGIDRWCALIGARRMEKRPCLVVMLGTATTLDALDGDGNFLGGMILPGFAMMKSALAKGTANLPLLKPLQKPLPDDMPLFPVDTENAMINGCLEAQAGAIERAFARLPGAASCLVSGGAAPYLMPRLSRLPARAVPKLVLEGVRLLALAEGEAMPQEKEILSVS
jgi:type III pantothenate kinase